jgi:6-phosphogluconolactonase
MREKLIVFPDIEDLTDAAVEHFLSVGQAAILQKGRFMVAFSGGTTPRFLYRRLTIPRLQDALDWNLVHIFWGDERYVPKDHEDSNYRMACEILLDHLPIPAENVHRVQTELTPEEAARQYEGELADTFGLPLGGPPPRFDLVLLGMGADGHTASLFPETKVLDEQERWVVAHYVEKLSAWRVTLTPVVLNAACDVLFMVSGSDKSKAVQDVLKGPEQPHQLPAQLIQPVSKHLHWFLDEQAAGELVNRPK